jgi:hypothetical protein
MVRRNEPVFVRSIPISKPNDHRNGINKYGVEFMYPLLETV